MRPTYRTYSSLLRGIYSTQNLHDTETRREYLARLNHLVPPLRQAYRAGDRGRVEIAYGEADKQMAYLLCYLPDYAARVHQILTSEPLANSLAHLAERQTIRVCSFGAGPCPEMVALCRIGASHQWNRIRLTTFDIDESWVLSQNLTKNFVCGSEIDISISLREFDLCSDDLDGEPASACANADLIVFQNVLNELENQTRFRELLVDIVKEMRAGAHLLLSDIGMGANYQFARRLHGIFTEGQLRRFAGDHVQIERTSSALADLASPADWRRLITSSIVRGRLELLLENCPSVLQNSHSPYKYNYLYFVKADS